MSSTIRALDILTDDPNRKIPLLSRVWPVAGTAAFGFAAMMFINAATRRPYFSGLQNHFIAAGVGGFIGKTLDGWRDEHVAERDAILRRYVELHPEDFPDQERKKFSQILQPWVPIR